MEIIENWMVEINFVFLFIVLSKNKSQPASNGRSKIENIKNFLLA